MLRRLLAFVAPALALLASPLAAQSVRVVDPSTGQPVFSAANPASVKSSSTGASSDQVQGNVAHDGVDVGNPVGMGCTASAAAPAAVSADGDRVRVWCYRTGQMPSTLVTTAGSAVSAFAGTLAGNSPGFTGLVTNSISHVYDGTNHQLQVGDTNATAVAPALSINFWNYPAASGGIVSSTADVAVKAAGGASVRNYVCGIDISHDTLSAATEAVLKDGATVLWRGRLQTAAADIGNGAGKITFSPCLRGTANTAVNFALITSVTGGVYVNVSGYIGF